jgi:hypothetical protein
MLTSRRISLALGAACLCLFTLASSAFAAGPATVTVRVEGLGATLLPPTQVTTTTAPVVKDGNSADACPGTSAAGALELATAGNWGGTWYGGMVEGGEFKGFGYSVESIAGEAHLFEEVPADYYWSFWLNHVEKEVGACEVEPETGAEVLFLPACFGPACPPIQLPLGLQAPSSAGLGEPVSVTVNRYSSSGTASPVPGASIVGGTTEASTNTSGHATVSFATAGEHTLSVTAPESVRAESTVCVHNANDGTCGTASAAGASTGGVAGFKAAAPYNGPFALVASVKGLIDGHVYVRRAAPRVLAGTILAHTGVSAVSLELRRQYKGRCSAYEGVRERFVHAGCARGSFFKVSDSSSFSYLLPSALAPGRYVLDIQASDLAGNRTTLARGSSRIVFYVR